MAYKIIIFLDNKYIVLKKKKCVKYQNDADTPK